jgi:hypothetical protein
MISRRSGLPIRLFAALSLIASSANASYINLGEMINPSGHEYLHGTPGFTLWGSKWDTTANSASAFVLPPGTPGSATWSFMAANLGLDAALSNPVSPFFDPDHTDASNVTHLSASIAMLLGNPFSTVEEAAAVTGALNVWDAASGFTNLGMVSDGGGAAGASAPFGGLVGDIRIGAYPFFFGVLAGAFGPATELFGVGGNVGGDVHLNNAVTWADDATDIFGDPDVDLFTVLLHELGHSLGLGHSTITGAVMNANYQGARRALHHDDIQAIEAIYGPAAVPEPTSILLLGAGIAAVAARMRPRRKQEK